MTREEMLDVVMKFRNPDDRVSLIAIVEPKIYVQCRSECQLFIEISKDGEILNVFDKMGILDGKEYNGFPPDIDDMTVSDIKERLDAVGVAYKKSAKKGELYEILKGL